MNIATVPSTPIGIVQPPVVDRRYGLRELVTTAFYHRRIMSAAFIVPVALGVSAALLVKPTYVGQARLLVLYGSEYIYQPTAGQQGFSVALDRNEIILGELQVLKSATLAMETLQSVGVDKVYPGTPQDDPKALEKAAVRMGNDLSLSSIAQSNILELSFRSYDPDVADDVLRVLIADYLKRRAAIFQRSPSVAPPADQEQLLARLHAADAALSGFAAEHSISSLDQQRSLLLDQRARNSQLRDDTAQAIRETEAKLSVIDDELSRLPPTVQAYVESDRSQQTQLLTENLLRLKMKRDELASRYNESFPEIQSLDSQIRAAQAQIAGAPSRDNAVTRQAANPAYQDMQSRQVVLRADLKGFQAKQTQLAVDAATVEAQIRDLESSASKYRDLQRTRDVLDEGYRAFVKTNEAAQLADSAERSRAANIRVIQAPEALPASLNMRKILAVGGVAVGLAAAVAAMALANALRQVFVTPRDASVATNLPVLAAVNRRSRRQLRRA